MTNVPADVSTTACFADISASVSGVVNGAAGFGVCASSNASSRYVVRAPFSTDWSRKWKLGSDLDFSGRIRTFTAHVDGQYPRNLVDVRRFCANGKIEI